MAARQYQRYESGEQDITQKRLLVLADFFNVSIDYLTGRSETKEIR
jgi:transcriptional regulator with XRE-family HTH domain